MKPATLAAGLGAFTLAVGVVTGCDSDNEPTAPEAPQTSMVNPADDLDGTGETDGYDASPDTTDRDDGTPAAGSAAVTVQNFSFGAPITVRAGTEVTIDNKDGVEHSVTSDTAGTFDEDVDGNSTATFRAPTAPGTYPFHCRYHPEMTGTLVVE